MPDFRNYEVRRESLKERYLPAGGTSSETVRTGGIDHLVLISSDLDVTIEFYTQMLGMRLTRIAPNRDDPTSTHIFFDMGGGNQLAFFDFPEARLGRAVTGLGSLQHLAVRVEPGQLRAILRALEERQILYFLHGSEESGAAYLRDPDGILLEMTTGYKDAS